MTRPPTSAHHLVRDAETLELLNDFLVEATDHLATADEELLVLERAPMLSDRDERVKAIFRAFHTMKSGASYLRLDEIGRLAHVTEHALAAVRSGKKMLVGPLLDAILDATVLARDLLARLRRAVADGVAIAPHPRLVDVVTRIEEVLIAPVAPARTPERMSMMVVRDTINVDAERVDELVDLVDALLAAQANIGDAPDLFRIAGAIQERVLQMRMIPVRGLFRRLARHTRELARQTGKPIQLETQGDATQLDRHAVDRIESALVQLIRDAADHGIEPAAVRRERGKPAVGTIHVRAYASNGTVVVELEDDGGGDEVVSLDVVKRNVEGLRGRLDVRSELGRRTAFRIEVPSTV